MKMKTKLILQSGDRTEQKFGKMKVDKAVSTFSATDWAALCREAQKIHGTGRDVAPPGIYCSYENWDGQKIVLHLYCENMAPNLFSSLETETMEGMVKRYSKRSPASDRRERGLDPLAATDRIREFYKSLPDKGMVVTRYGNITYATTCRDSRNTLRVMLFFACVSSAAVAGIILYALMRWPDFQPEWFSDFLYQHPWIENNLYRFIPLPDDDYE